MSTQSIPIQSPNRDLEPRAPRIRVHRRQAAALAARRRTAAALSSASPDRGDAGRQVVGARILRRWSVADLIARGTPRTIV